MTSDACVERWRRCDETGQREIFTAHPERKDDDTTSFADDRCVGGDVSQWVDTGVLYPPTAWLSYAASRASRKSETCLDCGSTVLGARDEGFDGLVRVMVALLLRRRLHKVARRRHDRPAQAAVFGDLRGA